MTTIIKQFIILIAVTLLLSVFLSTLGIDIYLAVLVTFFAQIVLYNSYMYIVDSITYVRLKQIELERIKITSSQTINAICPCDKKEVQGVQIDLSSDNYYKCNSCKRNIKAIISTETALSTEPVDTLISNKATVLS